MARRAASFQQPLIRRPRLPLRPLLHRYYLSGTDAFRLRLQLPLTEKHHERRRRERDALLGFPEEMDMGAAGTLDGEVA
jgi:hypothetical protein